jgi:hypothetical protein
LRLPPEACNFRLFSIFKFSNFRIFKFALSPVGQTLFACGLPPEAFGCFPFSNFQIFEFSHLRCRLSAKLYLLALAA